MERLKRFLDDREGEGNLRSLQPAARPRAGRVIIAGRECIDFSSNDYLGLSTHPDIASAARNAIDDCGVGAGASRLMSGDLAVCHDLEAATAAFKRKEAALVFNSGFQANLSIIPALVGRGDALFVDRLCHASIVDGAVLSRARLFRFRHNDCAHLESLLAKHRGAFGAALIVTESVFSMDGDLAPLEAIADAARRHNSMLMVDEAHATGVFGPEGRGVVSALSLEERVDVIMGTYSKALGGFGAYAASSRLVIRYLVNAARGFIYSTALPACIIASNLAAIRVCMSGGGRGAALLERAAAFREALRSQGWRVLGESQIVPVVVGDSREAMRLSDALLERGMRVMAVRPPTVPDGSARLRFSLSSAHSDNDLAAALEAMRELAGA